MTPAAIWRRAFAESLRQTRQLRSDRLVEAFATTPRDRFLGPGPWLVVGSPAGAPAEQSAAPRMTATADPQEVHQDVSVAIDAERALYNGPPGLVATWIDSLEVQAGDHVLHIGCGTGYYTAILAHLTGPTGRVTAVDADARLAARAGAALADRPWAAAAAGDGRTGLPRNVDVLVVHAGATHVLDEWLDAMRPGGRLIVPLTSSLPGMPPTLGKGVVLTARWEAAGWRATIGSMVMIYSLVALRDEAANAALGRALQTGAWAEVTRLRRDAHEPSAACWLHGGATCLSRA